MAKLLGATTALAIVWAATPTQAGPMWGYQSPSNTTVKTSSAAAGLTFPNSVWADGPDNGRIPLTGVEAWSVAPASAPDPVSKAPYTFDLKLTDYASGEIGLLNFQGILDGTIWKTGTQLTNSFVGPASGTLDLGNNQYVVTLDSFTAPSGFGDAGAGQITGNVRVQAIPESDRLEAEPMAAQTPEPTTALLGGIAAIVGFVLRRLTPRRSQ